MIGKIAFVLLLVLVLVYSFTFPTSAQNYYPSDIGNMWVLESEDGTERLTYTLETTEERFNGKEVRLLKITAEVLGTDVSSVDELFLEVGEDGLKLHKIIAELGTVFGVANVEFSPPAIFFPVHLKLGESWEVTAETTVQLVGPVALTSVNEVIAVEDVATPAGTFANCFKIRVGSTTRAALGITRSTAYQWLAPDVGPVKFENSQDIVFELVRSNLLVDASETYDVTGDGVVNILDLTFVASRFGQADAKADVNVDGTVNILDLTLVAQNLGK